MTAATITADMTGAKTAVIATGDLTVHGVTKSVQIPLEAQLTGDTIVVVGSLDVLFSDFGVSAPTAPITFGRSAYFRCTQVAANVRTSPINPSGYRS